MERVPTVLMECASLWKVDATEAAPEADLGPRTPSIITLWLRRDHPVGNGEPIAPEEEAAWAAEEEVFEKTVAEQRERRRHGYHTIFTRPCRSRIFKIKNWLNRPQQCFRM